VKIFIEVIGTFCNSWPIMIVEVNEKVIYEDTIKDRQQISIDFDDLLPKANKIIIGMNNKSFGRKGVWDTKTNNNQIIEDKTIKVLSFKLDDVECKDLFKNKFHVKRSHQQPNYFPDSVETADTMNYNGYFGFGFDLPLYNSLINKKFKNKKESEMSYFSNYTKVFHYEGEKQLIKEIKNNLREINEKFSHKRTKIRNS